MATLKKLFCLVDGETASRAFPIKVAHDDTVGDLKDLIKIKKAPEFDDIVADSLTLWRVSIPIVGDDKDEEFPLQLNDSLPADKNKLSPATLLLKVFPDGLPEETVHIIVQRPQQALKRGLQDADGNAPILKRFKPNATVYIGMRRYVYYADQTESNAPLISTILRGEFVRVYGARASGKSSRIIDAMTTLNNQGYSCVYVDMEGISVSSKEMLWSSLGKHLRKLGYPVDIKDSDDFLGEFYTQKKWGRPLVIFFDEFDALFSDGAAEACSSMLSTIRTIRNDPNRWTTGAVHSIVSIGTYAILQLNQTNRALSPFNISDNFRNTSLSRDQVRELFHEFADDRDTSIDDNVIENIFVKTGGHAGLINVCGVALERRLGTLSGGRHIDMDYLGSVEDTLLINMREYGTFVRLDRDLRGRSEMQKAALEYYRSCFLGNPSDKAVFVGMSDNRNLAEYLAALGALNPGSDGCFYIASPLMDSFIRQIVIPAAFPGAPNIPPPLRSDGSLDVLEVIKSALRLFDKDLISRAHELSYKEAHVVVDKGKKQRVPRESIYDSELIRILMNWLALRTGYGVVGQHHIQNLFCDVMVKVGQQDPVPIELVVTETQRLVQAHIDKTNNYRRLIGASEGWVIHLTREDNYLQNPLWPTDEMLDQGVYMIHVWHDKSFTEVRLSAKWRNLDGRVVSVENERVV